MARTHGKHSTYKIGCRCRQCTDANALAKKISRAAAGIRLATGFTQTEHGTTNTYTNHRCRCQPCRKANARYQSELKVARAAKIAADPDAAPHGRASTYTNWRCRCRPCTDAHAASRRVDANG